MKFLKTLAPFATAASVAALFAACGDDSSNSGNSNNTSGNIPEYETAEDMVHCTKSHYGEFAYVADEDSYYECTADGWDEVSAEDIADLEKSSSSTDDGGTSSSSIKTDEKDTAAVEVQKVDSVTIVGVAEKGPFVKDGSVTVTSLDSAFEKTKNTYKGKITENNGVFSIVNVAFETQYVIVEVNGFFMNEVTGKNTSGSKTTLGALVDLSGKDTVRANVNVLTELEMSRALYLVQNEKYNVPAAKMRATKEILAAFGVTVDSVSATDLSLMGNDAKATGLYVASIALLGDLSPSKFNNRLEYLSESFAATGSISDTLRAEISDFFCQSDSVDGFAAIMKNVKKINEKAPNLDKEFYSFWTGNYGLPACTSEREESIEKNTNRLSVNYKAGFACTSNRWHKSTALDTELGLCVAKTEGSFKKSENELFYTCKEGVWREITSVQYELKECSESRNGEYKSVNENFFLCKDKQWKELSAVEFELKDCNTEKLYSVVKTKTDGNSYVCVDGSWREASDIEAELGYCSKIDSTQFNKFDSDGKYYACLKEGWTAVDDTVGHLGFCTDKTQRTVKQNLDSKDYYLCVDGSWRGASDVEVEFGYCGIVDSTKFNQATSDGKYYVCLKEGWTTVNDTIGRLGYCTSKNKQTVVLDSISKKYYACDGQKWRGATNVEREYGYCVNPDSTEFKKVTATGLYYACLASGWTKVSNQTAQFGFCTTDITGASLRDVSTDVVYICVNNEWRIASNVETEYGLCRAEEQYVQLEDGSYYRCASNQWMKTDSATFYLEKVCSAEVNNGKRETVTVRYGRDRVPLYFRCDGKKWNEITSHEYTYGVCGVEAQSGFSSDYVGYCDGKMWKVCAADFVNRFVWPSYNSPYRCSYDNGVMRFRSYSYQTMTDSRDNQKYKIIDIGDQIWMAENLKYRYNVLNDDGDSTSYCYANSLENCSNYGRKYTWPAAMDFAGIFSNTGKDCGHGGLCSVAESTSTTKVRGVCPSGWHLPSSREFETLINSANGKSSVLKATFDWGPINGTNELGFSARPIDPPQSREGSLLMLWSSTRMDSNRAYELHFYATENGVLLRDAPPYLKYAVRCVKD